jgi:mono/diheme cytochrome c family protein
MRRKRSILWLVLLLLPACQQKMANQPRLEPDGPNSFFRDGRAARPVVPGTVARGHLRTDAHLYTGMRHRETPHWALAAGLFGAANTTPVTTPALASIQEADYVDTFPFPITQEVLEHGRNRYMIYCVVCHDPLGTGHGKIVERGYTAPPTYHSKRLREVPVGHIFDVITRGYGSMPEYRAQIPPHDRWAITAYIRALQLSQHFPEKNLTPEMRAALASKPDGVPEAPRSEPSGSAQEGGKP